MFISILLNTFLGLKAKSIEKIVLGEKKDSIRNIHQVYFNVPDLIKVDHY